MLRSVRIAAMADRSLQKMNLNEYMVTLERPLGIRFALSADGKVFVHSMQRGVYACNLTNSFFFLLYIH